MPCSSELQHKAMATASLSGSCKGLKDPLSHFLISPVPCGNSVGELIGSRVSLQVFIQCVQGKEPPEVQLADIAGTPC